MKVLQEKLDFLLDKYSVDAKAVLLNKDTIQIDGTEYKLLAHRSERRFIELKNIVNGGTLEDVSVMRTARIVKKGVNIYDVLYRELDLCQFILQRKIKSIMAMENGNVLNAIATCEDGVVCTLEIAATLNPDMQEIDKHEIIARRGTACDVVVDAQLKQDSIYVFADTKQNYTDVDFELYGLSADEIAIVRQAFAIAQNETQNEIKAANEELEMLVETARKSVISGEREVLKR